MEGFYLDNNNATIVPEHYWWCSECDALTPHKYISKEDRDFPWIKWQCEICGFEPFDLEFGCPNCGYPEPEEPGPITIVVHGSGCHFKEERDDEGLISLDLPQAEFIMSQFERSWERMRRRMFPNNFRWGCESWCGSDPGLKLNQKLKNLIHREQKRTCKCLRKVIYPMLNIHNFSIWSAPHLECSNAAEWAYDVRCEKCGFWYDRQDGNC